MVFQEYIKKLFKDLGCERQVAEFCLVADPWWLCDGNDRPLELALLLF